MLDGRWRTSVDKAMVPIGTGLGRAGISANFLTIVGLAFSAITAWLIATGRFGLAVLGVIAASLPDLLDGAVARNTGSASPRGAFFDSVADRFADSALLGGVAWYYADRQPHLSVLAFAVASLAGIVSYERAKAESLGLDGRIRIVLMERAERLIALSVGLAFGVLTQALWVMVVLTAVTAIQRFSATWKQVPAIERQPRPVRTPLSLRTPLSTWRVRDSEGTRPKQHRREAAEIRAQRRAHRRAQRAATRRRPRRDARP